MEYVLHSCSEELGLCIAGKIIIMFHMQIPVKAVDGEADKPPPKPKRTNKTESKAKNKSKNEPSPQPAPLPGAYEDIDDF